MQIDSVKKYLTSSVKTPYFLFISDGQYATAMDGLSVLGLDFVPMSGFCNNDDKMPDIDGLLTYIKAADVNANGKKFVVTGLGEFPVLPLLIMDVAVSLGLVRALASLLLAALGLLFRCLFLLLSHCVPP